LEGKAWKKLKRKKKFKSSTSLALNSQGALLTGPNSGLGRATPLALAQSGAGIILLARRADDTEHVSADPKSMGRRALSFPGDLANENYILKAVQGAQHDREKASARGKLRGYNPTSEASAGFSPLSLPLFKAAKKNT
jgi:NAD(P)-dependent dehydrogenase (short-subunit alcohol dehydrogenase family)